MDRNTCALALGQPAIEALSSDLRKALLASLKPGPRATLAEVLHRHDDAARLGVQCVMETADISRRTRQDPSTVRAHVRGFLRDGVLLELGTCPGRSRRIGLSPEFCFPLGPAYTTGSQKYDTYPPVSDSIGPDRPCLDPGNSPAYRHPSAANTLVVRAHLVGKTDEDMSLPPVFSDPSPTSVEATDMGECAPPTHSRPPEGGREFKGGEVFHDEPRPTSVKRTSLGGPAVDEDEALELLDEYVGHCLFAERKPPADAWERILVLLRTGLARAKILDAWDSDRARGMAPWHWEAGVNLRAANLEATLRRM